MSVERPDPGLERTALSQDDRSPAPPNHLALAQTQAPLPPALDKTLTPLPPDLERTQTPLPPALERTHTPLPPALARTVTPALEGDDEAASPLVAPTRLSDGEGRPALPVPALGEDRRLKDLVKAKLFRTKARPVKIGRYTVLDRLGEGGMGIVYTAYDDQLDRKVAVKVLRNEATRQDEVGRTRLLREAQAMARLSHPNIVTVHQADAIDDQVYIAMEFVRGKSLDAWLRGKAKRGWRDVLAVFSQAGRGLEAAHKAGIIHRDFKPHNVLVGDDGAVKVLDFGLARAVEHVGSEELAATPESGAYNNSLLDAPLTRTGAIMGTPAYMAPEQHLGRPASAASDQFSFCISLYEGLYGVHPFDCTTLATLVADVNIGKIKDPPAATKVPGWLRRVLQRGLAVDPARRYPSMGVLLAELARDPVAQRRRWLATAGLVGFVGAAGFGAASVIGGAAETCQGAAEEIAAVWSDERAATARAAILATGAANAADTWSRVQPRLDAYARDWAAMRTEACETHRAGGQSDPLFDLRTACLDQRRAGMAALVDVVAEADPTTFDSLVIAAAGLPALAMCADTEALTQAIRPPDDPAIRARVQQRREDLARAGSLEAAGRYDAAIAIAAPLVGEAAELAYPPLAVEALLHKGSAELQGGQFAAAETSLGEALWQGIAAKHDVAAAVAGSKWLFVQAEYTRTPVEVTPQIRLVESLAATLGSDLAALGEVQNNLGVVYLDVGRPEQSRAALDAALAAKKRAHGAGGPELVATLNNLAMVASMTEQSAKAIAHLEEAAAIASEALGADHPYTLAVQGGLGVHYLRLGRLREARETTLDVHARWSAVQGADGANARRLLLGIGDVALAERDLPAAVQAFDGSLGFPDGPLVEIPARLGLAMVAALRGDSDGVHEHGGRAAAISRAAFGADHPNRAEIVRRYAAALTEVGAPEEALVELERAREIQRKAGAEQAPMAEILEAIGAAQHVLGRVDEAEASLRQALAIREVVLPAESPAIAGNLLRLAEVLLAKGQATEAALGLRRAIAIDEGVTDDDLPELARMRFALAKLVGGAEGAALARQAQEALRPRGAGFAGEVAAIETWLKGQAG